MPDSEMHPEAQALNQVISALGELDGEAQGRVLDHVQKLLKIQRAVSPAALQTVTPSTEEEGALAARAEPRIQDIRALKEEKKPRSAIEMAALVAYYLWKLAPQDERKETITAAEIEKYFDQAKFPLPQVPRQTLLNAKAAGYFDSVAGGQYRLNPVGYNLVVHNLPGNATTNSGKTRSVRARRKSKSISSRLRKSKQAKVSRQRGV